MKRPAAVLVALVTAAGPALAQAAPGNTLNPSGGNTTRVTDERGLSDLLSIRRRSPAGFLYPDPLVPDRLSDLAGGWRYGGSLEFGGLWTTGNDDETRFSEFTDWSDGAFLEFFDLTIEHPESGFYADANGGSAGRDDQYYYGKIGLPGLVDFEASFSGVPHLFAGDATNIYEGSGSGVLRLPEPLVPGDNGDAEIVGVLETTPESSLKLQRDRSQLSLEFHPVTALTLFARYSFDDRSGERPFGGSLIFDSGGEPERVVETTEPRDSHTHNFTGGAWFRSSMLLANFEFQGSLFRNQDSTLTWDNPFLLASFNGAQNVKRGRFALAPDNHWYNVKGDVSVVLPWKGRLTTTASWSRARQDADLIPPTVNTGLVGFPGFNGVNLDEWNTEAALSRSHADAQVDTLLLNARLDLRPLDALRLRAGVRYYDQQNDTRYTARNPSTGQFGYIAEDGALNVFDLSRVFVPGVESDDFRYRSSPFDYRKLDYEINADYQLLGRTTLSGRYRREQIYRDEREREKTRENQARVGLTSRDVRWATLRASYEYRDREGAPYEYFPNRKDYVSSLPGYVPFLEFLGGETPPFTLAQLRQYDIADRERHEAKLSANFLPRDDLDLSLATRFVDQDYGASYGLEGERWGNVDFELGFQPSPVVQTYVFGHFEARHRELASINDAFVFPPSSDPNAGGTVFPLDNSWMLHTDEVSWGVGTGIRLQAVSHIVLDVNYLFVQTEEEYDFDIAGPGALGTGLTAAQDLPNLRTRNHLLQSSIRFSIIERASLRLFYRFERSTIRDFSQRNLVPEEVLLSSGALFLGHIDRNFDVHVIGLTLQIHL